MAKVYHPFDRHSGQPVTAEQMQARLSQPVQRLAEVVEAEALGERAQQAVAKARDWVVVLAGCIAWFWTRTRLRLEELDPPEEAQRLLEENLLAGYYWEMASQREKDPDDADRHYRS